MDEKMRGLVQLGTTWWGKSWIKNMLKHGRFFRMQRGITYSKEQRISNVIIKKGEVFALCQGTAPVPYRVRIEFTPIVPKQWRQVINEMGQSLEIEAKLISGEMPQHINKLFMRNGVPLFPVPKQNLDATCNCPDQEVPCKHIAAVILTLASIFDYDPFMLFLLRGMSREELLQELRIQSMEELLKKNEKSAMSQDFLVITEDVSKTFLTPNLQKMKPIEFDISKGVSRETVFQQLGTPSEINNQQFSSIMNSIYRDASKHANDLIYKTKRKKKKIKNK
ncbi:MAG: SWIM zinc finger family protein [Promethearchaeota archaeon]